MQRNTRHDEQQVLSRHIVMIGMMGAGKTAVGTDLARRLGVGFTDSDHEIERAAAMTVTEIFARDGEEFFRMRETEVLERLLQAPLGVVSTGGGAWMRAPNRALIRKNGVVVWLDCDLELLWARVKMRSSRPLLKTPDPKGTLTRLLEERRPVYAEADLVIQPQPGDAVEQTSARIEAALREKGYL